MYILKCSDGSYYTGSTSALEKRVAEHENGVYSTYTSGRLPVQVVYECPFPNAYDIVRAERQIKGWTRKKKEALIKNDFRLMHERAVCKNTTHFSNKTKA